MATLADVREILAPAAPGDEAARAEMILERALNYRQWVRELHETLGVPDEVVAFVAEVHPGTVRRWRSIEDVGEPRPAQEDAIESLRTIALVLLHSGTFLDLRGIGVWLRGHCRQFDWKPPYEVLAGDNGYQLVLEEAVRFIGPGAGLAAGFGPPRRELLCEYTPTSA